MAVDVYAQIERARALYQFAALTIAEDDERRDLAPSMAKAAAGDCQRIAFHHGIQLFGGLGFTWENDLQLYLKRAKVGETLFGSSRDHRIRVARATMATSLADARARAALQSGGRARAALQSGGRARLGTTPSPQEVAR
jgi:alkylation response protein AidB-like acyl-CoA dehydrogenase